MAKLTRVLGEKSGREVMTATLAALGLAELSSADQLRDFATVLSGKGGFAAAIGSLLTVHAATYDFDRERREERAGRTPVR